MSPIPLRRRLLLLALPAAAILLLGGCGGGSLRARGQVQAETAASPAPASTAQAGGSSTSGGGSLTLAMTQPRSLSTTVPATVTCAERLGRYTVTANDVTAQDLRVTLRAVIPGYTGPGSYQARVTFLVAQPGTAALGGTTAGVPLTVNSATSGRFSYSSTGPQGRTVATSVSWHCAGG
ncbi:MAG TPA: hypothetical protein VKG45_10385 [Actinomycetes bacterium]|nr:hypothetical protein [Actinomycetes bacterium]